MSILDVFKGDAFSTLTLTDAIRDQRPYPGRLGEMGLFKETSVPSLKIAIERVGDLIKLVSPSPRGAPGETRDMPRRSITSLDIPHFERAWSVYADEVQDVRKFGTEFEVQTVQNLVAEKLMANLVDLDLTAEHERGMAREDRDLIATDEALAAFDMMTDEFVKSFKRLPGPIATDPVECERVTAIIDSLLDRLKIDFMHIRHRLATGQDEVFAEGDGGRPPCG